MENLVAKLRSDLGDDMEIMIDCYLRGTSSSSGRAWPSGSVHMM